MENPPAFGPIISFSRENFFQIRDDASNDKAVYNLGYVPVWVLPSPDGLFEIADLPSAFPEIADLPSAFSGIADLRSALLVPASGE